MKNDKLDTIEESLAHQEQVINDLNDMVIHQGAVIEALKSKMQRLEDKIETLESNSGSGDGNGEFVSLYDQLKDQKPPHY